MRAVIELVLAIMLLTGGSRYALIAAHDYALELVAKRIQKGFSSTTKLNDSLWRSHP